MVAKLAPETLPRRLRGWPAILSIPCGLALYGMAMFETAPANPGSDRSIPARIVGFGVRERPPGGEPARVAILVRTVDGQSRTLDGGPIASRCQVGQQVSILRNQTVGGFERWSLPDAPCG